MPTHSETISPLADDPPEPTTEDLDRSVQDEGSEEEFGDDDEEADEGEATSIKFIQIQ